ncbi:hypothetical protein DDZ15_05285 [Rhodohalobacter mucosus]|uniref:Uncharacterized protein n=2 Tax=Rhodohalobacter mucosus TaxID=2079485 RepID=A0A316TTS8_9BACT|nr:hypothetical protein DDZ15_05285 [Rhodohalobacter mucosus]
MEWVEAFSKWFLSLGDQYGVNPFIFGAIYIGAIPFFTISVAWIVRNVKKKKPIALPVLSASGCFVSAYVYLMIAGENVPWWVYAVVIGMLLYGAWSTYSKIQKRITETEEETVQ